MPKKDADNKGDDFKESTTVHLRHVCLEYPYKQLQAATNGFHDSCRLGEGSAGTVFRAELPDGSYAAVKVIDLSALGENSVVAGFEDEIMILSKFRHPNLVVLMGWAREGSKRFLIYECLQGGDVSGRLHKCKAGSAPFLWHERLATLRDAATGLAHLHNATPHAFHRDIKSSNILLGMSGAKMADFGLSCVSKTRTESAVDCEFPSGTPGYTCPHYLTSGKVTEGSEVHSFGMLILEVLLNLVPAGMANGEIVYPISDAVMPTIPGAIERCVAHADPTACWPRGLAIEMASLALACIADDESRRPCFNDVCRTLRSLQDQFPAASVLAQQGHPQAAAAPIFTGILGPPCPPPPFQGPPMMVVQNVPAAVPPGVGFPVRVDAPAWPGPLHLGQPPARGMAMPTPGPLVPGYPVGAPPFIQNHPGPPFMDPRIRGPGIPDAMLQCSALALGMLAGPNHPAGAGRPMLPANPAAWEIALEVTYVHLAELSALRPEYRMLPFSPTVESDGRRVAKIGRQFQPQWFEAVLVDAHDLNCISREACEVSWGGSDPSKAALSVRALGSGVILADEQYVMRGDSALLQPCSRIAFASQSGANELCVIMSLVVHINVIRQLPPQINDNIAAHNQQKHATHLYLAPPSEGTWCLECIYAEGFAPDDFAALSTTVRHIEIAPALDSSPVVVGRQHQPDIFEALLSREPSLLSYISRNHFQFMLALQHSTKTDTDQKTLQVTNLSQNIAVVADEPLHQGETREIHDGDTLILQYTVLPQTTQGLSDHSTIEASVHGPDGFPMSVSGINADLAADADMIVAGTKHPFLTFRLVGPPPLSPAYPWNIPDVVPVPLEPPKHQTSGTNLEAAQEPDLSRTNRSKNSKRQQQAKPSAGSRAQTAPTVKDCCIM